MIASWQTRARCGLTSLLTVLALHTLTTTAPAAESCRIAAAQERAIEVDPTWAGTTVGYAALEHGGLIYFGYYDAQRRLAVASLDTRSRRLCVQVLDTVFGGWDSHNAIVMAFDEAGILHVAGNMHASPMVYARGVAPNSIDGLRLQPMVGTDEARVTYPRFVRGDQGQLLFVYRSGASGRGEWIVNRFAGGRWARASAEPAFAASWQGGHVSAYPSVFDQDDRGVFHVALVWRRSGDVATNFAVSYAATRDFQRWHAADGRTLTVPLTPDTADLIEKTGENQGLRNPPLVAATGPGQPIVAYSRYAPDGRSAVMIARPDGKGWMTRILAEAKGRTEVAGKGTAAQVVRLRDLDAEQGSLVITFPGSGATRYSFDPATLEPQGEGIRARRPRDAQAAIVDPAQGLAATTIRKIAVMDPASGRPTTGTFQFVAQSPNRDRPRACTPDAPLACDPPPSRVLYLPKGF